ncbi:MAG: rubrerythrin family protein [Fusobacteriaceae bacterium]|jgi:rubrerythrin|nr:rubrerythrin family protein [Fusobacteriaceae bacterium]MBU9918741.1 rubrerythrin family protein [Fusobacteriaceae bacterium]
MKLKGSKTAENLMKAYVGESQASRRYAFYASVAKKEGYIQISNIFTETSGQESEHAKRFFKFLNEDKDLQGKSFNVNEDYPIALFDNTLDNLKAAAAGEHEEWTDAYQEFAKIAKEEGFATIATTFLKIADVEERHEKRYNKLIANIENDSVFKKENVTEWKCTNCGYIHTGESAPKKCPACLHEQGYFEINAENY